QFGSQRGQRTRLSFCGSHLDLDVAPLDITEIAQALAKNAQGRLQIGDGEHAQPRQLGLLRLRERRRAKGGKRKYHFAPLHSITLSARSRMDCGIATPISFAVFLLITSSNLVGCSTGRSPGLAPLKILSTYFAAWR